MTILIPGCKLEVMILSDKSGSITDEEMVDQRAFVTSLFVKLDIAAGAVRGGIIYFDREATLHQALTYDKNDALVSRNTATCLACCFDSGN